MVEIYSPEARALIDRAVRQVLGEARSRDPRDPGPRGSIVYVGKTDGSGITAISTNTPGSGTVTLYNLDSSGDLTAQQDETGADVTITAYNLSATAVGANGWVMVQQDQLTGYHWCVWEDCP